MKKLATILSGVASILLVFIILFTTLQMVISNEAFINNEYTNLTVGSEMGISNMDLVRAYQRLVDYMEGRVSTIDVEVTINGEKTPMFNIDQERVHMQDVRTLWQRVRQMRDLAILICLILYLAAVLLGFKNAPTTLSKGYMYGFFVCMLFFGFFGSWALLDFSSFWTMFHESLFWNDLWLFDPAQSRMINMLPEQLFSDIVKNTAIYTAIVSLAVLAAAIVCRYQVKKKNEELELERERRKKVKALKAAGQPIPDELLSKKQLKAKKEKEREEARREQERKKRIAERERAKLKAEKDKKKKEEQEKLMAALNKKRKAAIESATKKTGLKMMNGPDADHEEGELTDDDDWTSADTAPLTMKPKRAGDKTKKKSAAKPGSDNKSGGSSAKKAKSVKRKRQDTFELVLPDEEETEE